MTKPIYTLQFMRRWRYPSLEKFFRLFCLPLLLFFSYTSSFSQVAKTTQAGLIEAGFGINPNLTGASSVAVKGNYAYVVGTGDVLQVLDITLPGLPTPKGSLANGVGGAVLQRPQHIVVQGNYAYITCSAGNAFEIVDISDPVHPVHKAVMRDGEGSAPYLNNAWGLVVSGNYAYVTFDTGLEIIDISIPASPVHKGSIHDGGGAAPYLTQAVSVFLSGNLAYVGTLGALNIIDISNPAAPVFKGVLRDGGGPAPFLIAGYSVYVSGNYAYVPDYTKDAIEIVDVSNPALPVHAASIVHNATTGPYLDGAFALTVSGNYLYVAGNQRNFEIIDITNPLAPVHKSAFPNNGTDLVGHAREVVIVGKYAYVPSRDSNGLAIIDISNPSAPFIKGNAASGTGGALFNSAQSVFVSDGYAYVGEMGYHNTAPGFEIVNVSNPAVPLHTSSIPVSDDSFLSTLGVSWVTKLNNIVYATNYKYNALVLVDVTNPLAPFEKSSIRFHDGSGAVLEGPTSVQVHPLGGWAYVTSFKSNAVEIINVPDVTNPRHVSTLLDGNGSAPYLKRPSAIALKYLLAPPTVTIYGIVTSFGSNALEVLDLNDNYNPTHTGSLLDGNGSAPYLKKPTSVFVKDNYAYVASYGSSALEIVDITNPAAPVHKGAFKSPILDSLNFVYVAGNFAYITCAAMNGVGGYENGRMEVIDVSDPANPTHYETFKHGTNGALIDYPTSVFVSGGYAYITNAGIYESLNIVYLYGPDITSFSPASASVGSTVTVTGKNFNTFITASVNGVSAKITEVTENTVTLVVPPGATNGTITLHYAGQDFATATNFTVTPTTAAASDIQQSGFTANWSDVGATKYFLDVSVDNFTTFVGSYSNLEIGNVTSLAFTGLNPATTYQYRVRSSDGTLISINSNVTTVLTIPATPVESTATLINQTNFTANWTTVSGATNYFLDVASDIGFTKFLVGYNNLSVAGTSQIVNGLSSFTNYYYRVRSANATGSSTSSNVIEVITLDITAPVIGNPPAPNPTTLTAGASPVLNSIVTDNVSVDSAQLFYRGVSKSSFKKVSMQGPGGLGGNYSITVQPEWYDSLGMEYYFVAKDKAGNKATAAKSFIQLINPSISIPTLPSGSDQSNYRIIAFPYQLADNKVTSVYNNVPWNDNTKAGLWWWNPILNSGAGDYDQYGVSTTLQTIDPGKGYWAITSTPVTPTLSNVSAPKYNQSNLYTMTLKPGWNEVGNPYPVPVSWDQVIAYNQATNPGASFSALTTYDGSGYKSATGSTLLPAFQGGFVKNLSSSDINIQIPFPGQVTTGGRTASISSDITNDDWNINLHINQNGRTNQLGGFGMHRLAQSGVDRYDNFNPPSFLGIPEVNFINSEYPELTFSNDMVQSQDNYTWTFTPAGKEGKVTQLVWNNEMNTNSSKQLFLLDEELLTVIDMNEINQYDFVLTKSSRFRIFYGSDVKITSSRIIASAPFPNPLTSESRSTVNLALPESESEYAITMQIYNAQGGIIGSINKRLTSGIHPFEFSLPSSFSQGIYLYKLSVSDGKTSSSHTGKIVKL